MISWAPGVFRNDGGPVLNLHLQCPYLLSLDLSYTLAVTMGVCPGQPARRWSSSRLPQLSQPRPERIANSHLTLETHEQAQPRSAETPSQNPAALRHIGNACLLLNKSHPILWDITSYPMGQNLIPLGNCNIIFSIFPHLTKIYFICFDL